MRQAQNFHDDLEVVQNAVVEVEKSISELARFQAAYELAPDAFVKKALEELRKMRDWSDWSIRILIERNADGNLSKRDLAEAAGVNIGSITRWQDDPLPEGDEGVFGPGALPRPGRKRSRGSS